MGIFELFEMIDNLFFVFIIYGMSFMLIILSFLMVNHIKGKKGREMSYIKSNHSALILSTTFSTLVTFLIVLSIDGKEYAFSGVLIGLFFLAIINMIYYLIFFLNPVNSKYIGGKSNSVSINGVIEVYKFVSLYKMEIMYSRNTVDKNKIDILSQELKNVIQNSNLVFRNIDRFDDNLPKELYNSLQDMFNIVLLSGESLSVIFKDEYLDEYIDSVKKLNSIIAENKGAI